MSEASFWGSLRKIFYDKDPVRVENRVEAGTPDVNLSSGEWIELKWVRKKPKNEEAIFVIDHYTAQQRTWSVRRIHAGGKVFLFLKVGPEYLLFRGDTAAQYLNKTNLINLRKVAIGRWVRKLNATELRKLILE